MIRARSDPKGSSASGNFPVKLEVDGDKDFQVCFLFFVFCFLFFVLYCVFFFCEIGGGWE